MELGPLLFDLDLICPQGALQPVTLIMIKQTKISTDQNLRFAHGMSISQALFDLQFGSILYNLH